MDSFLTPGYEVPKEGSRYMKFLQGPNKIRILAKPILGWVAWTTDDKPVRVPFDQQMPKANLRPTEKIKHFWAMPVWDYKESKVKILELTQSTIQETLKDLAMNEEWGSPLGYDVTISRKGEKLKTEYTVVASPKKDPNIVISQTWAELQTNGFNLHNLFENKDPFGDGEATVAAEAVPAPEEE